MTSWLLRLTPERRSAPAVSESGDTMGEREQRVEIEPGVYKLLADCTAAELDSSLEVAAH
jgi:hypothetical protein